jgi:hypothetical protein
LTISIKMNRNYLGKKREIFHEDRISPSLYELEKRKIPLFHYICRHSLIGT